MVRLYFNDISVNKRKQEGFKRNDLRNVSHIVTMAVRLNSKELNKNSVGTLRTGKLRQNGAD
jgi:hypothetical protein